MLVSLSYNYMISQSSMGCWYKSLSSKSRPPNLCLCHLYTDFLSSAKLLDQGMFLRDGRPRAIQ